MARSNESGRPFPEAVRFLWVCLRPRANRHIRQKVGACSLSHRLLSSHGLPHTYPLSPYVCLVFIAGAPDYDANLSCLTEFHGSARRHALSKFTMPAMSPTMTEGGIAQWKKKEGESYAVGDVLLEIVSPACHHMAFSSY